MKKILGLLMLGFVLISMTQNPKTKTINIQTSAVCEMCKDRLEEKLNYTKGVVYAELNLENKVLTVKYKTKFLTATHIKQIVAATGYHADEVPRNETAFKNLPDCCQDETATCTKK
ncbi:MAG: heavy-metal-associated domain-containing protein [Putridiphycobacter sp.]